MTTTRSVQQPDLEWEHDSFGATATWTTQPSIDIIKEIASQHLKCECTVAFLAQGAFNKVFTVTGTKGTFIFRVALPVAPKAKTLSEVAIISLIRTKTTIPVPRVLAYNADLDNHLGFEWILMEHINGRPLKDCWHELSWLKKGLLVQKIVKFMVELSHLDFASIGNVYQYHLSSHFQQTHPKAEYVVGEAVQGEFFRGEHIQLDLHRGPYQSSAAYVSAHTQFLLQDTKKLRLSKNKHDHDRAKEMQLIYDKLQDVIPKLFPISGTEMTYIYHDDLSVSNIIVDDNGDLSGIIDWEAIIAAPPWEAFQVPKFIDGDEDVVQAHHDLVQDYEATQLKRSFLEEMLRENPQWIQTYNEESTRQDVLVAIVYADNDMYQNCIKGWLDYLLEGRELRMTLSQSIDDPF